MCIRDRVHTDFQLTKPADRFSADLARCSKLQDLTAIIATVNPSWQAEGDIDVAKITEAEQNPTSLAQTSPCMIWMLDTSAHVFKHVYPFSLIFSRILLLIKRRESWQKPWQYCVQEALLLQRNRATRYVSWNIMAVFWLSYWQEALLMQRNHASTLSIEIV